MPEANIENITTLDNTFAPTLINYCSLPDAKFNGDCLLNIIFTSGKVINLYISYTLNICSEDLNTDFTLDYNGYSIGFDARSEFSLSDGSIDKNVIIFEANMSSSMYSIEPTPTIRHKRILTIKIKIF